MNVAAFTARASLAAALLSPALFSSAHAQNTGGFNLPPDYSSRFGSISAPFDTAAGNYGVRYFPLPLRTDLRIIYVQHKNYSEFGLYSRYKDTDFLVGNLEGGSKGIATFKVDHNPWQGIQYTALMQGSTAGLPSENFTNYVQAGYAKAFGPVRLYGALGYGALGQATEPFTHVEVSAGKDFPGLLAGAGLPNIVFGISGVARNYYYPVSSKAFSNVEGNIRLGGKVTDRFDAFVQQIQRKAFGTNVLGIGDGDYSETNLNLRYAVGVGVGPVSLRSAQYNLHRLWLDNPSFDNRNEIGATFRFNLSQPLIVDLTPGYDFYYTAPTIKGDVLLRLEQASVAFGPSIKYVAAPAGHRWIFGIAVTDKSDK